MEEVRQLVQEEGREARNLVAFHVAVDTPAPRIARKPPRSIPPARRAPPRPARLRSASAGRDKRSELRARYWALLFGDLQRAIGEIYNTVEAHENLSECQEVILVLENYTRDFKALCEWFRVKWEYDNTPPPQRPQSLAWEIRKTDFVRPESRKPQSVKSSPSVSGKNSPSLSGRNTPSGKNSPNLFTGKTSPGSGKVSPRILSHSITSPKSNIEFFSNKIASKVTAKPEPKSVKDVARLSDIKEKVVLADANSKENGEKTKNSDNCNKLESHSQEIRHESKIPKSNEALSHRAKATVEKLNLMECAFLEKQLIENSIHNDNMLNQDREKEPNGINNQPDKIEKNAVNVSTESSSKSEDNFADVSSGSCKSSDDTKCVEAETKPVNTPKNETDTKSEERQKNAECTTKILGNTNKHHKVERDAKSPENISNEHGDVKKDSDAKRNDSKTDKPRPAYSQAAAKPKIVTATAKVETKSAPKSAATPLARSKTVVEIRQVPKPQRPFPKRNQTVKCSYPFNLTTGRTSLFDASKQTTKKPSKPVPTGAGDNKTKIEHKKVPLKRPSTLKLNESGDKKEKTQLENIRDCEEYSSSETVVTQIDMSRIESSESLRTLIAEDREFAQDVANSIEVLNVDRNKNDNEGWLTVKSRRLSREYKKQSKSHWSNRFHQPSATTSLPTLNMIESPRNESKSILTSPKHPNSDRAKSEQPQMERKVEKSVKVVATKNKERSKNTSMIRQKSDVTGLKTRSARNKTMSKKSEKIKDKKNNDASNLTKNRLHSSLESLTGLSRSQESTEEPFDFDKWKAEFKSTFKYLDEDDQLTDHNEILKDADPSEMSEIAEMTSQIEENERKISLALDFQSEVDQRKLSEEEDLLNRQIMELQQVSDVDIDTETDDTETDLELISPPLMPPPPPPLDFSANLEDQYESVLEGMSWAERVDTLHQLEQLVSRHPGRAQQLHAKLSQGIKRRGSFQDALRRLQAKQARAEQHRQELQTERTKRIHSLLTRVEEVKVAKNQLIEEKRLRMERRLQKAAENRDQHIKDIVRKAHDEEEKLREIAFIKQLEAENRRHEFLDQCRSTTGRLRILRRERLDKLKQKAAREAAVGLRRQALEQARRLHVENLLEKRKERDARVEELKELKKQERDDAAREKAEGVKSRLSALAAAADREAKLLRSRIHDKQHATQQRLHNHLQNVRARATRQQTTSESYEIPADEENEIDILNREKKERDRQKALKKRARKLRQKLLAVGQEYEELHCQEINLHSTNSKVGKILNQINTMVLAIQNTDNKPQVNGSDEAKKIKSNKENAQKQLTNGDITDSKKAKKKKGSSVEKQMPTAKKSSQNDVNSISSAKENISTDLPNNTCGSKKSKKKKNKEPSTEKENKTTLNSCDKDDNSDKRNTSKDELDNKDNLENKDKLENKQKNNIDKQKNIHEKQENNVKENNIHEKQENNVKEKNIHNKQGNNDKQKKIHDKQENNDKQKKIHDKQENNDKQKKIHDKQENNDKQKNIHDKQENNDKQKNIHDKQENNDKQKNKNEKQENSDKLKNNNDRPKLVKSPSIASTLSDMSKVSYRSEKKLVNIDWVYFEKVMNELNRAIEKVDKSVQDTLLQGMKVLLQLLGLAADKDENGLQITSKCLSTVMTVLSRVLSVDSSVTHEFLNSNGCVHTVKLLATQLEKDLTLDKTEQHLAIQCCICVGQALESMLQSTRLYEEAKELGLDRMNPSLAGNRQRAHNVINYLSISGSLSHSDLCEGVKGNIQSLVTVCANLCRPCDVDTGQDRSIASASLRSAVAGDLGGARSEFCSLFEEIEVDDVSTGRTTRLLRALAELDHTLVQEAFGEGHWLLEFRAAVARLLSQRAPTDREPPKKNAKSGEPAMSQSEEIVLDLIVLIGLVVVNNAAHQETLCDGWSAVKILCNLPANWIVSEHSHALLPTLAALAQYPPAAEVIAGELSLEMIKEFVESPEADNVKLVQIIKEGNKKNASKK